MRSLGITLLILGLGSFLLNHFGIYFFFLMWVDTWGETVGHVIRGGLAALGLVLIILGRKNE